MTFCYDILWRIDFPAQGPAQARVRMAFPSLDAVSAGSCTGTLQGHVMMPRVTGADGSRIVDGTCALKRLGDALRFDAVLPFEGAHGAARLSVCALSYGRPEDDTPAHVRLEGPLIGAAEGTTLLHLPRFVADLSQPAELPPMPGHPLPALLARLGSVPGLRGLAEAGRRIGWPERGDAVQSFAEAFRLREPGDD